MSFRDLKLTLKGSGVEFSVAAAPGSSRAGVRGVLGESVKVALRSAPEKGRANAELRDLIASLLKVRRSRVSVVAGSAARRKRVRVEGLGMNEVLAALDGAS